jgi:hypothetical protein
MAKANSENDRVGRDIESGQELMSETACNQRR